MRKTTIPILSTLIAGLIFSPIANVSAAIENRGATWWSVQELLDYHTEVEEERIATCGDDFDCNMDFEMVHYENSEKYRALHNILEGQIWVTSINPAEETIKVLFYDEDMMLKHMGIHENLELEHLYFGWFEEWNGQIYNYNHDSFTDGTTPGSHPLYDSTVEDLSVITPWEEVELSVAGGNLIDNPTGKIDYAAFAKDNKFNAQGYFDYSACLQAADYTYGAECQLMSSSDQGYSYFPPREQLTIEEMPIMLNDDETTDGPVGVDDEPNLEPTDESPSEPTEDPEPASELNLEPIDTLEEITNEPYLETAEGSTNESGVTDFTSEPISEPQVIVSDSTINNEPVTTIQAPETGTITNGESNATEFPWWLGAIIAINGLTLIWLFLPVRTKAPKTSTRKATNTKRNRGMAPQTTTKSLFSPKKSIKTLDKNYHLR